MKIRKLIKSKIAKRPKVRKSAIGSIADRLKQVDQVHNASLKDAERLKTEGTQKHDQCTKKILEVQKKLDVDPNNKQLQKDKAALIVTRDMMLSSVRLNENLIKNG